MDIAVPLQGSPLTPVAPMVSPTPQPPLDAAAAGRLLQALPVALVVVGDDGIVVARNDEAAALLGGAGAPGRPFALAWSGGDADALLALAAVDRPVALTLRVPTGTGARLEARSRAAPGVGHAVVLRAADSQPEAPGHDIRSPSTSELESQLAIAVELGEIAIWRFDFATQRIHFNDQALRVVGLTARPGGMTIDEVAQTIHPDDRGRALGWAHGDPSGRGSGDIELRYRRSDGGWRTVMTRRFVQRGGDGRAVAFVGVGLDVTERRDAENALRDSQAKSRFLARMSHELRTPLNAVLGFAQLLIADDGADAGDAAGAMARRRAHAGHIAGAGRHLLSLINDVLDLSSLEGGEVAVVRETVALAPLLDETLPLLSAPIAARRLTVTLGPVGFHLVADTVRLRQVLLNLLSNAIKYNRDGGVVAIDATARDGEVVLRVADSGRGMDERQLAHLFEPFNRLGLQAGSVEGSGIGLSIVKSLVERMGGRIVATSTPGVGSAFEVTLPAAAPTGPDAEPPAASRAAAAASMRAPACATRGAIAGASAGDHAGTPRAVRSVLYVEDNAVNALIVSELLAGRADIALHVAVDGADGVAQALALQPDLVLLDMQLPDCDGIEVLARLRAEPSTRGIDCIALSANAMPDDIDRARRAGAVDYWTKPIEFAPFIAALDRRLGIATAAAAARQRPARDAA